MAVDVDMTIENEDGERMVVSDAGDGFKFIVNCGTPFVMSYDDALSLIKFLAAFREDA